MHDELKTIKASIDLRDEVSMTLGAPLSKGKSWCWPCPFHAEQTPGGFHVFADGYRCFSCNAAGDLYNWRSHVQQRPLGDVLRDALQPAQRTARATVQADAAAQRLESKIRQTEQELERARAVLKELNDARKWETYHEGMTDFARQLWEKRGVPAWYQDFAFFGFDADHVVFHNGAEYHTPTLTIPIFAPVSRECLTIKHRLLNPPDKSHGNKYRPERAGLGSHLFVADPDTALAGKVVVVEGEIKAAVTFATLESDKWQVVGLPGKTPSAELLSQLSSAEQLVLCLDPDARKETLELGDKLGAERVRVLELPDKIDDMIVRYGLDKRWLERQLVSARRL